MMIEDDPKVDIKKFIPKLVDFCNAMEIKTSDINKMIKILRDYIPPPCFPRENEWMYVSEMIALMYVKCSSKKILVLTK